MDFVIESQILYKSQIYCNNIIKSQSLCQLLYNLTNADISAKKNQELKTNFI